MIAVSVANVREMEVRRRRLCVQLENDMFSPHATTVHFAFIASSFSFELLYSYCLSVCIQAIRNDVVSKIHDKRLEVDTSRAASVSFDVETPNLHAIFLHEGVVGTINVDRLDNRFQIYTVGCNTQEKRYASVQKTI